MLFVRLKTLSIYRQFIRNSLRNTSMIAKAFWISATHTNTNSRRRLLRSYKAFVYFGSRTSRPRPRLLMLTRRRHKRCERVRKRGKRGGIRARLRANPTRPALPTLILLVEFMFVKCRTFYLPWEFTAIVIGAVYIPPCANAKDALRELYCAISEQQTNNPMAFSS